MKFGFLMQRQSVQELIEIIDTKILREGFFNTSLRKDIFHHTDSAKRISFLKQNRLIDVGEVLEPESEFYQKVS